MTQKSRGLQCLLVLSTIITIQDAEVFHLLIKQVEGQSLHLFFERRHNATSLRTVPTLQDDLFGNESKNFVVCFAFRSILIKTSRSKKQNHLLFAHLFGFLHYLCLLGEGRLHLGIKNKISFILCFTRFALPLPFWRRQAASRE